MNKQKIDVQPPSSLSYLDEAKATMAESSDLADTCGVPLHWIGLVLMLPLHLHSPTYLGCLRLLDLPPCHSTAIRQARTDPD